MTFGQFRSNISSSTMCQILTVHWGHGKNFNWRFNLTEVTVRSIFCKIFFATSMFVIAHGFFSQLVWVIGKIFKLTLVNAPMFFYLSRISREWLLKDHIHIKFTSMAEWKSVGVLNTEIARSNLTGDNFCFFSWKVFQNLLMSIFPTKYIGVSVNLVSIFTSYSKTWSHICSKFNLE